MKDFLIRDYAHYLIIQDIGVCESETTHVVCSATTWNMFTRFGVRVLEHSSKRIYSNKSIKFMTKVLNINPDSSTEVTDAVVINLFGL